MTCNDDWPTDLHGLCFTDPHPWIDGDPACVHTCRRCPALQHCRDWAAQHEWADVVIAGWRAPEHCTRPPWARPHRYDITLDNDRRLLDRDDDWWNTLRSRITPNPATGCHTYTGRGRKDGIPVLTRAEGSTTGTTPMRRIMWLAHNGPIPRGHFVTNTCGHDTCVNPNHHRLTQKGGNP